MAAAYAETQAPARRELGRQCLLGESRHVASRKWNDRRSKLDSRRAKTGHCEEGEDVVVENLPDPDSVEAFLFCAYKISEQRLDIGVSSGVKLEADSHHRGLIEPFGDRRVVVFTDETLREVWA